MRERGKRAAANHGARVGRPRRRAWTPIERDAGLPLAKETASLSASARRSAEDRFAGSARRAHPLAWGGLARCLPTRALRRSEARARRSGREARSDATAAAHPSRGLGRELASPRRPGWVAVVVV